MIVASRVALLAAAMAVAAACAPSAGAGDGHAGARAGAAGGATAVEPVAGEIAAGGDAERQAMATIDHLMPRPDSSGPQPVRFAWTPIAGADSYAIALVSEIDVVMWQAGDLPKAEVDWPKGLDVPEGTYFWMVEGYRDGRRVAESGRAAFIVER